MADENLDQRLTAIEASLSEIKATLGGVASNVSVRHLGEQVAQAIREGRAVRADIRLLTGIANGIATAVQALVDHQMQLADRVSALETEEH